MSTNANVAALDNPHHAGHFVRFYDEDSRLIGEVSDFIGKALRVGGTGIVIANEDHIDALRRNLYDMKIGQLETAPFSGRLIVLDAEEALAQFMVGGWPDEKLFDSTIGKTVREACAGGPSVHAFGEMVAVLCEQGLYDAAIRLEQLWNSLGETCCFSLFCAYSWDLFPTSEQADAFRHVCETHDHVHSYSHSPALKDSHGLQLRLAQLEQKALSLEFEVAGRKKSEQELMLREKELADFMENAAEGIHRVGADGTILWANQAELKMLGYQLEEYIGRHIAEFHVDRPVIDSIMKKLQAGETLYDQPSRLRCKDGSIKHVVIHSNGHFENGKLRYTRCFTRDATERHQLEQVYIEREALLAELTKANRAKDEFLALLGHELRNPLSPIVTALELIRLRGYTDIQHEHKIITRHVEHLTRLVGDLLDIARITRGEIDLQIEHADLSLILGKAVEMASPLFERRGHQLSLDVETGLQLEADPVRLAQVVANLLTNAARYTNPGGHVWLSAKREGDSKLSISVRDNGIGIAPEMLPRLFELFFQGERTTNCSEGGLGIGLSLVKNIIELHEGSVEAQSEGKGTGSEFTVRLPLKSCLKNLPQTDRTRGADASPTARAWRIMLVDDNVDAAETLAQLLSLSGHTVDMHNTPNTALNAVRKFRPEIAILDIGLPTMDGYELATRIRSILSEEGHSCRLIALTGYGQDADKERAAVAGFQHHIVKPVDLEVLLRLANDSVMSSSAHQAG